MPRPTYPYIKADPRWAYLAVVQELHSRQVVGWVVAPHMRKTLIIEALEAAVGRRDIESGLLLHSDRGFNTAGTTIGRP